MDARRLRDRDFREAPADLQIAPAAEIDSAKLQQLATGIHRKSRYQRDKEAAEEKQRKHEEEAAAAYEDFVASFEGNDDRARGKSFVRAGGESRYAPPVNAPTGPRGGSRSFSGPGRGSGSGAMRSFADDEEPLIKEPVARKKRQMDSFLEEMKREQAHRDAREAARVAVMPQDAIPDLDEIAMNVGSHDVGDPETTNIHVSNLPSHITEMMLGDLFARLGGPVGSVKIMWPRPNDFGVAISNNLQGFVALMKRPDAERAYQEINGLDWNGKTLLCSWGKPMPLPPRPAYVSAERERSPSPKRRRRSQSRSRSPSPREWPELSNEDERFVKAIADKIKDHGYRFESTLKDRERGNPRFAFLEDEKSPKYHYLRMLLDRKWKPPVAIEMFEDEGPASAYSSDSAEHSETRRSAKTMLGKVARKRFETMLRGLTTTREKIARPMAFALEHCDAAEDVVGIIVQSLLLPATPVPRKLARLYLVSDILHNSAASIHNAWRYRTAFEKALPPVFEHLNGIYRTFPGRMKAEAFKQQIAGIIAIWDAWLIFTPGVVADFQARLSEGSAAAKEEDMDVDGAPTEQQEAAPGRASGFRRL